MIVAIVNYIDKPQDLYQCTLTNRTFYNIANPKLWHAPTNVTKTSYSDLVKDLLQGSQLNSLRLLPLGQYIRQLDLYVVLEDLNMKAAIGSLFTYTPLLEAVLIHYSRTNYNVSWTPVVPENLPLLCPRLRKVSVEGYTIDFLRNLGNCLRLDTLHLKGTCANVLPGSLGTLRSCQLDSFSVESDFWAAEENIRDIQQLARISTLRITSEDDWDTGFVGRLLILSQQPSTSKAFPNLVSLYLNCIDGKGVDSGMLVNVLTTYSKLQELDIVVSDLNVVQGHVFPHLRSLVLTDSGSSSQEAVPSWINACPDLVYFKYESYEDNEEFSLDRSDIRYIQSGGPLV